MIDNAVINSYLYAVVASTFRIDHQKA